MQYFLLPYVVYSVGLSSIPLGFFSSRPSPFHLFTFLNINLVEALKLIYSWKEPGAPNFLIPGTLTHNDS